MPRLAQVFEHGALAIGEQGLTEQHFAALVRYNERNNSRLFTVGHRRLKFGSFVGVLQVGALTIEILPKADKGGSGDKQKWQNALIQMLRICGVIKVDSAPEAKLHFSRSPLIDLYLNSFLSAVEHLSHAGLVKKYRVCEENLYKLKGRIVFRQQIARNLVHSERMFTAHQTYDRDNLLNRILKRALKIISLIATTPSTTARAKAAELSLEAISDTRITVEDFERLTFDRNTERYRTAIQLARLIILNYSPDLRGGSEDVMAIVFDMNRLFERFVLVQLRQAQRQQPSYDVSINAQRSQPFWGSKQIRPDILLQLATGKRVIVDTKWKIPANGIPSDDDLKQMYAYNVHFGATHSLLIYPRAEADQVAVQRGYERSEALPEDYWHSCATHFLELFDVQQKLRRDIGTQLLCWLLSRAKAGDCE